MNSFAQSDTKFEPPLVQPSYLPQIQQCLDLVVSFQQFDQHLQINPEFYGSQLIIMEETNPLFVNQQMNDAHQFAYQNQLNSLTNVSHNSQLQESYQGHEYPYHNYYQIGEIANTNQLIPTTQNIEFPHEHIITGLNCNILDSTFTSNENSTLSFPRKLINYPETFNALELELDLQSQSQSQSPSSQFQSDDGSTSEAPEECSTSSATMYESEPFPNEPVSRENGDYYLFINSNTCGNSSTQMISLSCPVRKCRHHKSIFDKRSSLLRHCFKAHTPFGEFESGLEQQEMDLLSQIIPKCQTKNCGRFFSRNDSLKRHLHKIHGKLLNRTKSRSHSPATTSNNLFNKRTTEIPNASQTILHKNTRSKIVPYQDKNTKHNQIKIKQHSK